MIVLNSRRLATCLVLAACFVQGASAAEILIADAKSQPESLTVAPGGVLIVGSSSSSFVYRLLGQVPRRGAARTYRGP
jgi:hypothetical protein